MTSKSFSANSHEVANGETEIVVTGEIDMTTAPAFDEELSRAHGDVVVDLRKVSFMDSRGIHVLLTHKTRLEETSGRMRLVVGTEEISRILELTGLTDMFDIDDSSLAGTETPPTTYG